MALSTDRITGVNFPTLRQSGLMTGMAPLSANERTRGNRVRNRILKWDGEASSSNLTEPKPVWNVHLTTHDDGASARWAPLLSRQARRSRIHRRKRNGALAADRAHGTGRKRIVTPVLAAAERDEIPLCPAVGCAANAARFVCDNGDLLTRARVTAPRVPQLLEIELSPDRSGVADLALWLDRYGGVLRAQTSTDEHGSSHRIADLVFHHCCLRVEITARVPIIEETP